MPSSLVNTHGLTSSYEGRLRAMERLKKVQSDLHGAKIAMQGADYSML